MKRHRNSDTKTGNRESQQSYRIGTVVVINYWGGGGGGGGLNQYYGANLDLCFRSGSFVRRTRMYGNDHENIKQIHQTWNKAHGKQGEQKFCKINLFRELTTQILYRLRGFAGRHAPSYSHRLNTSFSVDADQMFVFATGCI